MATNLVNRAIQNLAALVRNVYPGRGIILGVDESSSFIVMVYWIMGRSPNSQNRLFGRDGWRLFTKPADPSKVTDPRLIIYNAMDEVHRVPPLNEGVYVVSNGHQTDAITSALTKDWYGACAPLSEWTYEPDANNFTNRISGISVVNWDKDGGCYKSRYELSVLQKSPYSGDCLRFFYQYEHIPMGHGYCVTTYTGDGEPLPAFDSTPYVLPLEGDIHNIAQNYWKALNPDNRVALAVKFIPFQRGDSQIEIINRFTEVTP